MKTANNKPARHTRVITAQRRLPPLLRRAWFSLNQAFRRLSATEGVTPDQYTVLRLLQDAGRRGLVQRELVDLMTSDPNTIASLLKRMVRSGFVQRQDDPEDRRAFRIRNTPAGTKKYRRVRRYAIGLQERVLKALPVERQQDFLADLEIIANACRALANQEKNGCERCVPASD